MLEEANPLSLNDVGKPEFHISDQTTPTILLPMTQEVADTTTTALAVIGEYTIPVASVTGLAVGQHIRLIDSTNNRYYFGAILAINALVITLDTQIDFAYTSGSEVTVSNLNMAVNGSVTPVVFTLRTGAPSIPSDIDITRLIITCTTATAVDLNKFGDLTALTRGLAFRAVNGAQYNIFNIKSNQDLANICYDWLPYASSHPTQGIDGFTSRLTFAGQDKLGVALRVPFDGNLEMLVQDNLTGLTNLRVFLGGHVVQD